MRHLPVLLYHHVGKRQKGSYPYLTVTRDEFRTQIQWLLDQQFRFITLSECLKFHQSQNDLKQKSVLLTFDDAFRDLEENALSILKELKITATIFVVTSQIGGTNHWDQDRGWSYSFPLLSRDQICYWSSEGLEFGAHSHTHRDLSHLTPSEVEDEVRRSKDDLESILGKKITAFAYPFGSYNESVRNTVSSMFDLAFTTKRGLNSYDTDRFQLRRTAPQSGDANSQMWLRTVLGWTPADRIRNLRKRFFMR